MRLPGNVRKTAVAIGLLAALSACAGGGGELAPSADYYAVERAAPDGSISGPQADYPQVLGAPYVVDGQTYTPADVLSYDAVGYATLDMVDAGGVTISHKTLPLPSYVELTALDTGKTILARAERRGPMTSNRVVGLSQGAARELGVGEGAPVRVRRVNPPEYERAALRSGQPAGARLDTPDTLLAVLRKNLPAAGSVDLARTQPRANSSGFDEAFAEIEPGPSTAVADNFDDYQTTPPPGPTNYALAPIGEQATGSAPRVAPVEVARLPATRQPTQRPPQQSVPTTRTPPPPPPARTSQAQQQRGRYVIQVASFSSKENAIHAADTLSGFVVRSGAYFRTRMGPFVSRGEAEAALAKARRAGYRDAYLDTSD